NRRAMASVALIDVLDDVLTSFVLEIDIDIRRLVPLLGNEAGKEKFRCRRIDLGNAKAKADRAVRRRAAPLAEDSIVARKRDHIMDGQEVMGIFEAGDEREFIDQRVLDIIGYAVRISFLG